MKANKVQTTERILKLGVQRKCVKLELQNIIFPKWSELGLIGEMFRQCVITKEQPEGNIYDELTFQTVMRVLNGKLLISEKPDCYCWKMSKVESSKDIRYIGSNSAEGLLTLCDVLNTIHKESEKKKLADMFANMKKDLILATTPAEERFCIEITPELYEKGVTCCVDQWMEIDEDGNATVTMLNIGDFLIVTTDGVYCIRNEEFLTTHTID